MGSALAKSLCRANRRDFASEMRSVPFLLFRRLFALIILPVSDLSRFFCPASWPLTPPLITCSDYEVDQP